MRIKQKLIAWFIAVSLLVGSVGFLGLYANDHVVNSYKGGEEHFGPILEASNEVSSYAKRAEGHAMLFITLHNETDRQKFFNRMASLREQSAIIDEKAKYPEARKILEDIKSKTDELQSTGDALFRSYDNETKTTGKFKPENHEELIRKLDDIAAKIREDGVNLAKIEVDLQTEQEQSAQRNATFLHNIILVISAVAIIIALVLGYAIARDIANPVMKLKDAATDIGKGNLGNKIKIDSKDEIGELAAAFNKMAEDLERSNTERKQTEEIRLENEHLAYASKAKSEFLANMSHELRTPLNSIIGFSELLKQNLSGELNEKQMHYVDNVLTSSKFLLNLINDILDLSKVEAGKIELAVERISIPHIINETLSLIKEKAAKHNVVLNKELDPALDYIEADPQRFKQILFNLLSNAVKFSKPEGGVVTIAAKNERDMALISVSDTGIGIKAEDIGRLFKEFEQIRPGISKEYGGTGLGLAISKKLVELHGGRIDIESRYGEGSTFTFSLPLTAKRTEEN